MDKPVTAEEKLLRFIRKKKSGASKDDAGAKTAAGAPSIDFLKYINRFFVFASTGILIYISVSYFYIEQPEIIIPELEMDKDSDVVVISEIPFVQAKPFETYAETFTERNVFQSPWEKPQALSGGVTNTGFQLSQLLKVVGIVLDHDPKVAVEDIRGQQTYLLSVGDEILGAFVEEIKEEKVIFVYNGEKVELGP